MNRQWAAVRPVKLSGSEKSEYRAMIGRLSPSDVCGLSVLRRNATVSDLTPLGSHRERVNTDNVTLYLPRTSVFPMPRMPTYKEVIHKDGSDGIIIWSLKN